MSAQAIKVLAFDTFGTVTDWHTGVSQALARIFPAVDAGKLARDWRRTYPPALAEVESGARAWTLVDELHSEALVTLLDLHYQITATDEQLEEAVRAWHLLPGWPDSTSGLQRLKAKYTVCALSNGNVALLTEMAKHASLPWDFIGGADIWGHYKPAGEVYLGLAKLMQVRPSEVLMVATHASDLAAARSFGLRTAYIERPAEWGPEPKDETRNPLNSFHCKGIDDLADHLGC